MALELKEVTEGLPTDANHGFKLFDGEELVMFFHWHDNPNEEIVFEDGSYKHNRITYADVLAALPDRLETLGYKDQTDELLGEVVGRFGAG